VQGRIDDELLCAGAANGRIFSVPFKDLKGDAQKIRQRAERLL